MVIAIIMICIVFIILLLCLIRINIAIEYNRDGVNDHIILSLFILKGLVKYKYEIPEVKTKRKGFIFKKVKEKGKKEKDKSKKREKISYGYILKRIKYYRNLKKSYGVLIEKILRYLKCRLQIKKLDFSATIGTDNAHQTAVLIGLCWSFAGLILSFIHNNLNLIEKNINIKPDYMGKKFKVDLFCILNVRIGHIIIVGLICLVYMIKNKIDFVTVGRSVSG
jgi:hypothetical protein